MTMLLTTADDTPNILCWQAGKENFPGLDGLVFERMYQVANTTEQLSGAFFFGHFHDEHEADMRAWLERVRKKAS